MMHLEVRDENGYLYDVKQELDLCPDYGHGFKEDFARLINNFMDIMTWPGYKNEYVFLESVTEEEYDFLLRALADYRKEQEKEKSENKE